MFPPTPLPSILPRKPLPLSLSGPRPSSLPLRLPRVLLSLELADEILQLLLPIAQTVLFAHEIPNFALQLGYVVLMVSVAGQAVDFDVFV